MSPSPRAWYQARRDVLFLALGITILLLTAHYAPGVTHTSEYNQYGASQIELDEDDGLTATDTADGSGREVPELQGLFCHDAVGMYSYECAIVPSLDGLESSIEPDPVRTMDEFAYDWERGEFVRFSHNETDGEPSVTTEPVEAELVFEALALEADRVTEAERTAIEDGAVTTDYRLATHQLLEWNGDYYVVVQTGTVDGEFGGTGLTAIGYALGFGFVIQGYRRAIGHEIEFYPDR